MNKTATRNPNSVAGQVGGKRSRIRRESAIVKPGITASEQFLTVATPDLFL